MEAEHINLQLEQELDDQKIRKDDLIHTMSNLKEKLADWRDREAHMNKEHHAYINLVNEQKRV